MRNIIIVGNGPAGISASLYTTRAGIQTTIIGNGDGALGKAMEIENYYGLVDPISGSELVRRGVSQAQRLGAQIIKDEVVGISYLDKLTVYTKANQYTADSIILATGV